MGNAEYMGIKGGEKRREATGRREKEREELS